MGSAWFAFSTCFQKLKHFLHLKEWQGLGLSGFREVPTPLTPVALVACFFPRILSFMIWPRRVTYRDKNK